MHQKLKSPFQKLRNFGLSKQGFKEAPAAIDEVPLPSVSNCMQNASDMRNKWEGLLANGQIISGAAYDFARSLQDMASYMMECFGEAVDEEIGNIFSLLAKVQFEMAKLLDLFAAHVSQTIIKPTEVLMENIEKVEIMKNAYDDERKLYLLSLMQKKSSKTKRGRGKLDDRNIIVDDKRLKEKVDNLTSYVESLKLVQVKSLVTQGVQYHSAHMHLFSKGFGSVNAVEPMIRQMALNRMIDTTLSEEDASVYDFRNSSVMTTKENAHKCDSCSDSAVSSSSHLNLFVEQAEPSTYVSDSSEEFYQRRRVVTSQSAPISPFRNHRMEPRNNEQTSTLDTEYETSAKYVLPSPVNDSSDLTGIKMIKKLERRLESFSNQVENSGGGNLDAFRLKPRPDMPGNELSSEWNQAMDIQQQDGSDIKAFPSKHSNLFVDHRNSDFVDIEREKGRRYTQSGPVIESSSSIKSKSQNEKTPTVYEDFIPPLYKSGPIQRSSCLQGTVHESSLLPSMPLISELHKLPLPPPGYVTPPKSPNNTPMAITHSAPLGNIQHMDISKPVQTAPFVPSSPSKMTMIVSSTTPIIQLED